MTSTIAAGGLSFPSSAAPETSKPQSTPAASSTSLAAVKNDSRLYVGNLHPTVDEYTLLTLFSKYGKVARLDCLFHKSGPAKGKPRGYAFVEYSMPADATKALSALHDKLIRGRKIVVTFATQTPYDASSLASTSTSSRRRHHAADNRPTALSLIKTHSRPDGTNAKIAALEAKLKQMQEKSGDAGTIGPSSLPKKPSAPMGILPHGHSHRSSSSMGK